MQRDAEISAPLDRSSPMASAAADGEAEAQQAAIVEEEERSTDALESAGCLTPSAEELLSSDYSALVRRGAQLTITLAELLATARRLRAIASSARQRATVTRDASISLRNHTE